MGITTAVQMEVPETIPFLGVVTFDELAESPQPEFPEAADFAEFSGFGS